MTFVAITLGAALPRASVALTCSATIQDLVFGQVSVRDGARDTTISNVTVSCSGGTPSSTARICLNVGTGGGGAAAGNSPRYMLGGQGATLAYQLTSDNFFYLGGNVWNNAVFDIALDGSGAGITQPAIYGEITSTGDEYFGGSYLSIYGSGSQVSLYYGTQSGCTTAGNVNDFQVSANVIPSCTITAWPLYFGEIEGSITGPIDQVTKVDVSCTADAQYVVKLGLGTGNGVTLPSQRKMTSQTDTMLYGLYLDAARSAPWGDGSGAVYSGTGSGLTQSIPVFGRIHSPQDVSVGDYSDSVIVTIEY